MNFLCLVFSGKDIDSNVTQAVSCAGDYDLAEIRIDSLSPDQRMKAAALPSAFEKILGAGFQLILSCRQVGSGGLWGKYGETEGEKDQLLTNLLMSGEWAYLDLNYDGHFPNAVAAARKSGTRLIYSRIEQTSALLDRPVGEIARIMRMVAKSGDGRTGIPRLETPCSGSRQLLTLSRLSIALSDISDKLINVRGSLTDFGGMNLLLPERFGSLWSYAESPKKIPDPMYRFKEITPTTPLYGVTGNPISHSRSPELHNGWLKEKKHRGTYLSLRSDNLTAMLEVCDIMGVSGLSVTVPHKERALKLCDYADPLSQKIGAANTLIRRKDGWHAWNTDATGFILPLLEAIKNPEKLMGKTVLIIGAGGAAKAVVQALDQAGASLIILNRTLEKAVNLAASAENCLAAPLSPESLPLIEKSRNIDIVVQTTVVGMHPHTDADPIPWWNLEGCSLVYDLIYNPEETILLKRAKSAGVQTLNGTAMLRTQAALQFENFTGFKPPEP